MMESGRELLILGILRRAPMSAYALNRTVRAHAPLYRPLKQGNVYHAIASLHRQGLCLSKAARSQRGPQPTKEVFRISATGEQRFHALLQSILMDVQAPDAAVDIALVLLGQLPRAQARRLLGERLREVTDQQSRLGRLFEGTDQDSGAGFLALMHTNSRLHSEQRFLNDSLALLDNGRWNPGWTTGEDPIVNPKRRL